MNFFKKIICLFLVVFSLSGISSKSPKDFKTPTERYISIIFEHGLTKKKSKFHVTKEGTILDSVFYNDIESSIYNNKVNIKIINMPNDYTIKTNIPIKSIKDIEYNTDFSANLSYGLNEISVQIFDNQNKLIISDYFTCTYQSDENETKTQNVKTDNTNKLKYIIEGFPDCSVSATPVAHPSSNSESNKKIGTISLIPNTNNFIHINLYNPNNDLIVSGIVNYSLATDNYENISINFNNNDSLTYIITGIRENYTIKIQYFKENQKNDNSIITKLTPKLTISVYNEKNILVAKATNELVPYF